MIAAIALHHGLELVTGNTSHYQRIQQLGYPLTARELASLNPYELRSASLHLSMAVRVDWIANQPEALQQSS